MPPAEWNPEQGLTDSLRKSISNESLPPKVKAKAVYEHSRVLVRKMFDSPTAELIGEGKTGIHNVVDMILNDESTALNMLSITSHDFYTYTHSVNVGVLGTALTARLYPNSDHNMHELGAAFFSHDLGKVRVEEDILNKRGRLNEQEMKRMRIHPYQSFRILQEVGHLSKECGVIAMQHHEREDGSGYPRRLKGDEIHDCARICCIADVFDALTAERSYKRFMSPFDALNIMKEEMLGHFQPEIFSEFVRLFTS